MMGIVKRLDDQKRTIELVRSELKEMKSKRTLDVLDDAQIQRLNALAQNVETALAANKRLADSMIKIREVVSSLIRENEKLRAEMATIKGDPKVWAMRASAKRPLSDADLAMIQSLAGGAKSPTQISRILGRSREHTSRMVRKMVELGLFEKESQKYPPRYVLTKVARDLLESSRVTSA